MMKMFVESFLGPTVRRLGSLVAGALTMAGMHPEQAAQVELGLIALAMYGVDLLASNLGILARKS